MIQDRRAEIIAAECRQLPDPERAAAVERRCGADTVLRAEVERLLAERDSSTSDTAPTSSLGGDALHREDLDPNDSSIDADMPERIGRYRVIRKLGQGGFGVVYLATPDDGIRRAVAVKLLKPGVADVNAIRRFNRERQILPSLHHPNIAGFLDADETEDGQPYFVMEYVEGTPITEYCDRNGLTVAERLALFGKVCDAVQYAHERFVLHRDLKPWNILVDREGVPKLLDFGIARLLSRDPEASADLVTIGEESALTPEYASPEQLRGDPLTVGSDVYSLGVVLYELLTGQRPYYLTSRLRLAASRLVDETRVLPPSDKLTSVDPHVKAHPSTKSTDPGQVATRRGTSIERLRRMLVGDIDNIVLTALRKEPIRRYQSVRELVEDIRHHQKGEPVKARGDAWSYRAGKFVVRHRVTVGAALVVLASGITVAVMVVATARAAEASATDRAEFASKQAAVARDFLQSLDGGAGQSLESRRARLHVAKLALDRISQQSASVEYAELLNDSVATFNEIITRATSGTESERREASLTAHEAVERWRALADDEPDNWRMQHGLATALRQRASLYFALNEMPKAQTEIAEARRIVEPMAATPSSQDEGAAMRESLVRILVEQARQQARQQQGAAAAMATLAEAQGLAERSLKSAGDLELAATVRERLAELDERADDTPSALGHYRQSLEWRQQALLMEPASPRRRAAVMNSLQWVSRTLRESGQFAEAERLLNVFMELAAQASPNPDSVAHFSTLARGYVQRGNLEGRRGDPEGAVVQFDEALDAQAQALAFAGGQDSALKRRMGQTHVARAEALSECGRLQDADLGYAAALDLLGPLDGNEPTEVTALLATAHAGRARIGYLVAKDAADSDRAAKEFRNAELYAARSLERDARYRDMVSAAMTALVATRAAVARDHASLGNELAKDADLTDEQVAAVADAIALLVERGERGADAQAACALCRRAGAAIDARLKATPGSATAPRLEAARARIAKASSDACS